MKIEIEIDDFQHSKLQDVLSFLIKRIVGGEKYTLDNLLSVAIENFLRETHLYQLAQQLNPDFSGLTDIIRKPFDDPTDMPWQIYLNFVKEDSNQPSRIWKRVVTYTDLRSRWGLAYSKDGIQDLLNSMREREVEFLERILCKKNSY